MLEMLLNSAGADCENRPDLGVGLAGRDQRQNLALASGHRQPGKMFAAIEMLLGQVFLVTLIAGLVSLWRPGEWLRRKQDGTT